MLDMVHAMHLSACTWNHLLIIMLHEYVSIYSNLLAYIIKYIRNSLFIV